MAALREHLGDTPFMVDANQQWDRARARRMCRELEAVRPGLDRGAAGRLGRRRPRRPVRTFDTPIATGEMLTSVPEHMALLDAGYRGIVQPDAPRIGGITPFLRFATLASHAGLALAPHYAMEIHLHLAAAYPTEPWVEHFEWLNPLFEERIDIRDGQMWVPDRPGLGFTLSDRMRSLTRETATFDGVSTTLAQRVVSGLKAGSSTAPSSRGEAAVGGRADRGVRRLPDGGPRGGHPAAGRGPGRDLPGPRVLRAGGPRADVVHVEASAIRTHHDVLAMIDFRLGVESEAAALAAARARPRRPRWRSRPHSRRSSAAEPERRWRRTSPSTAPSRPRPATASTSTSSTRSAR